MLCSLITTCNDSVTIHPNTGFQAHRAHRAHDFMPLSVHHGIEVKNGLRSHYEPGFFNLYLIDDLGYLQTLTLSKLSVEYIAPR